MELSQAHQHGTNADKPFQKRCGHELGRAGTEDYTQFDRAPLCDALNTRNRPVVANDPQPTATPAQPLTYNPSPQLPRPVQGQVPTRAQPSSLPPTGAPQAPPLVNGQPWWKQAGLTKKPGP